MPSTLHLDRDTIGPSDPLIVTLTDGSLDFQASQSWVRFFLKDPHTPRTVALYYRFPDVTILGSSRAELRIREVGTGSPNKIPPGTYDLVASVPGHWEAWGDRAISVVAAPQTAPSPTFRQTASYAVSSMTLSVRLSRYTIPLYFRWAVSYLRFLFIRLLAFLGLARLVGTGAAAAVPARGTRSYLQPLADGAVVMPAVYNDVVHGAEEFLEVATWGFDDTVRMSDTGQHDAHYQAHALMRAAAARITSRLERRSGSVPWQDAPPMVRVLVWDASMDDDYEAPGNDLSRLGVTLQPFTGPQGLGNLNNEQLADQLRLQGDSGANRRLLGLFHTAYKALHDPLPNLPYPSGVLVVVQNHPDHDVTGSHHQKFTVSERRAYVGGVNFLKEYWDRPEHRAAETDRATSRGVGSGGSAAAGPLHDTGAILADQAVQQRLHWLFSDRWNNAIRHEGVFEGLKNALWIAQHQGSWRDRNVYSRLRDALDRIDVTVTHRLRNHGLQPAPILSNDVESQELTLTLPQGSEWGAVTETDQRYRTVIEATRGFSDTIYIESQYFPDRLRARSIYAAWVNSGRPRSGLTIHAEEDMLELQPFAHIVIPYEPSTSPFDVSFIRHSEFEKILEGELKNLRWLEIKTMRLIRQIRGERWERVYTLTSASRISILGRANNDPDHLETDTEVTITNLEEYGTRRPVASITIEVQDFLPEGDITVYTLAASDAASPAGADGRSRQRQYLRAHGIYVHSKAAIFLRESDAGHVATVGSANLLPRSLRADSDQPDSETNVWWTGNEGIEKWYNQLVAEHTGFTMPHSGVHSGTAVRTYAFDQLNSIRTGSLPSGHLIRLDLSDRWLHLDPLL